MATHAGLEAEPREANHANKLKYVSVGQPVKLRESSRLLSRATAPRPGTASGASTSNGRRRLRRIISREEGCALETIGHAVDYLTDCYLREGEDNAILDFRGPTMDAIQILISTHRQVLHSLPLAEPLTSRLWNRLLRRKSTWKSSTVVPLTSSR